MEQSPATSAAVEPSQDQTAALESLKAKVSDSAYPTLKIARLLQSYIDAYKVGKVQLAGMVGLRQETLFQYLRTLTWSEAVQVNLENAVLSPREIQALSALGDIMLQLQVSAEYVEGKIPAGRLYKRCDELKTELSTASSQELKTLKTTKNQSDHSEPLDLETRSRRLITPENIENSPDNSLITPDNAENSKDDDEDDIETPMDRFKHFGQRGKGSRAGGGGRLPISFLILRALLGLFFGGLAFGMYLISTRGYQAVVDLEERTGDYMESKGPEKFALWLTQFAVILFCLIFFRLRIAQFVHWLRSPKVAQQQQNTNSGDASQPIPKPPVVNPVRPSASGSTVPPQPKTGSGAPAAPTEVHADVQSPDIIVLSWRAVGPNVTYNVYSSASSALTNLRKENEKPLHKNVATWTPETGLDVYWITVTAVDEKGHESAYSEAIQVIRHPQPANDNNGVGSKLLDKAGNALQKYAPW